MEEEETGALLNIFRDLIVLKHFIIIISAGANLF